MRSIAGTIKMLLCLVSLTLVMSSPGSGSLLSVLERGIARKAEKTLESGAKSGTRIVGPGGIVANLTTAAILAAIPAGAVFVAREGEKLFTYFGKGIRGEIRLSDPNWKDDLIRLSGDASGDAAPRRVIFDEKTANSMRHDLDSLNTAAEVYIVNEAAELHRLKKFANAGWTFELKPGLVVPLSNNPLSEVVRAFLEAPVEIGRLNFVTTMTKNDADAFRRLGDAGMNKLRSFDDLRTGGGKLDIPGDEGSLTVFIGHVENGGYALVQPDGRLTETISFEVIEQAARDKGISAIFVGCNTYSCGSRLSGTTAEIRETEILAALDTTSAPKTNAELLAAFGTPSQPFVITSDAVSASANRLRLDLERLDAGSSGVRGTAVSIRALGYISRVERSLPWEPVVLFFVIGSLGTLALQIFDAKSPTRIFNNVFPNIPNRELYPVRHFALWIFKSGMFLLFSPVITLLLGFLVLLAAFNLQFSVWRGRDDIMEFAWMMVVRPITILVGFLVVLSELLLICVPTVIAILPMIGFSYIVDESTLVIFVLVDVAIIFLVVFFSYRHRALIIEKLDNGIVAIVRKLPIRVHSQCAVPFYFALKVLPAIATISLISFSIWSGFWPVEN
jgi:hypothetical protein